MKKVFAIAIAICMLISCAVVANASTTSFDDESLLDKSVNNRSDVYYSFRDDMSNSHSVSGYETNYIIAEGEDNQCVQFVTAEAWHSDNSHGNVVISMDLKPTTVTGLAGIYAFGDPYNGAQANEIAQLESGYFKAVGMTLATDCQNVIIFVANDATYTFDTGLDLTEAWHTYAAYTEANKVTFTIDEKIVATVESADGTVTIKDNAGEVAETISGSFYTDDPRGGFMITGTGMDILGDNLVLESYEAIPTEIFTSTVAFHGASFDTIYINDAMPNAVQSEDGSASAALDAVNRTVDGSDGSISTISVRGWIGFNQPIDSLGYQIGDQEPVFGSFLQSTEEAVQWESNGGQYATRFKIDIPVSSLKGSNAIVAVAKVNGQVIKIDESCPTVGQATCPNTSFTYVGPADSNAYESVDEATPAIWIGNGSTGDEKVVKFATTTAFDAVTFPTYWASAGTNAANVVITLVNKNGDTYTAEKLCDNNYQQPSKFEFGEVVPAGSYTMTIDVTNKTSGIYFVMAKATSYNSAIKYESGEFAFGLNFTAPAQAYYLAYVDPAPSPATADASLAIFVLAAAAIALVVLKKKAF